MIETNNDTNIDQKPQQSPKFKIFFDITPRIELSENLTSEDLEKSEKFKKAADYAVSFYGKSVGNFLVVNTYQNFSFLPFLEKLESEAKKKAEAPNAPAKTTVMD